MKGKSARHITINVIQDNRIVIRRIAQYFASKYMREQK